MGHETTGFRSKIFFNFATLRWPPYLFRRSKAACNDPLGMNNSFGFSGRVNKPIGSLDSGVFIHTRIDKANFKALSLMGLDFTDIVWITLHSCVRYLLDDQMSNACKRWLNVTNVAAESWSGKLHVHVGIVCFLIYRAWFPSDANLGLLKYVLRNCMLLARE